MGFSADTVYQHRKTGITVQAWTGPEGCRRLRLPDIILSHLGVNSGNNNFNASRIPENASAAYTPKKIFLVLISESAPGPSCDQQDYASEFQ